MGGANGNYEECRSLKEKEGRHVQWVLNGNYEECGIHDDHDDDDHVSDSEDYSIDSSIASSSSSSSLDMGEEDASSTSPNSYGPLYELSDLMAQLPVKKGLSKYYQGKSQSFGCLANVKSLEDLAKKGCFQKRKLKPCKSYGGGLDVHKYSPKPTITKKATSRGSFYMHI